MAQKSIDRNDSQNQRLTRRYFESKASKEELERELLSTDSDQEDLKNFKEMYHYHEKSELGQV